MHTKIFRRYQDAKRKEKAKSHVLRTFGGNEPTSSWVEYYRNPRYLHGHYTAGPNRYMKQVWSREYRRAIRDELRKEEPQVFPFHKVTSSWDWY